MEASMAFACDDCDKTFGSAQGLALHRTRKHSHRKPRTRAAAASVATANGTVDALARQLALALLDQALEDLRTKVHAAL